MNMIKKISIELHNYQIQSRQPQSTGLTGFKLVLKFGIIKIKEKVKRLGIFNVRGLHYRQQYVHLRTTFHHYFVWMDIWLYCSSFGFWFICNSIYDGDWNIF
mmetsp:Transcript_19761/g.27180  ORF Transcript_19761/g.27180 Transcript_19761/m.27180 type:complete len:102 (+) Transcript_19761:2638-2943(+)